MNLYRVTARVSDKRWDDQGFIESTTVTARDTEEAADKALAELTARYPTAWILTVSTL